MFESVRSVRPTRRGWTVIGIAVFAFALGAGAGARSLNAVVVPAIVALLAGSVQLVRADAPTVDRTTPEPGFSGDRRTVAATVESAVPCTVTDDVGPGATPVSDATATVGHGGEFEYELELERRGEYELGPASCRLTDSLGLFTTTVESPTTATGLVYPDVYELETDAVSALVRRILGDDRASFDRLREFTPGDTMRDIDWRASARRPNEEFLVAEYESYGRADHVRIVGESTLGNATVVASCIASVVAYLHDRDVSVSVAVENGETVSHPGEFESLLQLLARTGDGWTDRGARTRADVYVLGNGGKATISLADRDVEFDGIADSTRRREVVA